MEATWARHGVECKPSRRQSLPQPFEAGAVAVAAAAHSGSLAAAWAAATSPTPDASLLDLFFVAIGRALLALFAPVPLRASYLVFDASAWLYMAIKFVCAMGSASDSFFLLMVIAVSAVVFTLAHFLLSRHACICLPLMVKATLRIRLMRLINAKDIEKGTTDSTPYASGDSPPVPGGGPPPMSCCKKACRVVCQYCMPACLCLLFSQPLHYVLLLLQKENVRRQQGTGGEKKSKNVKTSWSAFSRPTQSSRVSFR